MSDQPTTRQKQDAFLAVLMAPTLELKRQALERHREVLLRKYSLFEENITTVAMDMLKRQGGDTNAEFRYTIHTSLIDDARKLGIDEAIRKAEANPYAREHLVGMPDEKGTVIAQVIFMEDRNRPHPFLSNGEAVQLVAYPSYLEVRKKFFSKEELVAIPWDNIDKIYVSFKIKGALGSFGADVINSVIYVVGNSHDGVVIQYQDTIFHSKMTMFFRTQGEKNASKLTKQLMQRLYDYRRRKGELGGSF